MKLLTLRRMSSAAALIAAIAVTGCNSYKVWDHTIEVADGGPVVGAPRARIANPELADEALIIRESKLYRVNAQPDEPCDVTLRLSPLKVEPYGCGGGMFLFVLTLGLGPGATNETFTFSFEEVETGHVRTVRGGLTHLWGPQEVVRLTGRERAVGEAVGKVFAPGYQLPPQREMPAWPAREGAASSRAVE
jgi:hypothetical protein